MTVMTTDAIIDDIHAPNRIEEMIKRHETMAKEYRYQKTIQDMIRENLVGGEFVIMMIRDRGKSTLFKL